MALTEAPPRPLPAGEDFPVEVQRADRYAALVRAMNAATRLIAAHFRDFAVAIAERVPLVVEEMAGRRLDEYDDAVDRLLGVDISHLQSELTTAMTDALDAVVGLGMNDAASDPAFRGLQVHFDIDQPYVQDFMRAHTLERAQGMDTVTRSRLATVLRRDVAAGQSVEQTTQDIMQTAKGMSQSRARLIAQSETMYAYNGGKHLFYEQSGLVEGVRFIDGQYGACPYCQQMNNRIIRLTESFESTIGDVTLRAPFPPLHPGCRCTTAPVLIGADLQDVGGDEAVPLTFADRIHAEIERGVENEADVTRIGGMVREEIEARVERALSAETKRQAELEKEFDRLDIQLAALDRDKNEAAWDELLHARTQVMLQQTPISAKTLKEARIQAGREVLSEIRPLGPGSDGPRQPWAKGSTRVVRDAIEKSMQYMPRDWLERSAAFGELKATSGARGYYQHFSSGPSRIVVPGGSLDTALHEMGHRFEYTVPRIAALEKEFYARRTAGEPVRHLGAGYGRAEVARFDQFVSPYMGKRYAAVGGRPEVFELLSMGQESIFGHRFDLIGDPDMHSFILGLLAAL